MPDNKFIFIYMRSINKMSKTISTSGDLSYPNFHFKDLLLLGCQAFIFYTLIKLIANIEKLNRQ